ncbi:MAG: adenine deaminase [Geminicoccaceae bacterium]|nr:adenine deaminase [Geminicoccaceae bacterium]
MSREVLERAIDIGRGLSPADIVLKGGQFLDMVTGDLLHGDIAIAGDRIAGTMGDYDGYREIDIAGRVVVPGFIDTHLHVESSLVTPLEFDRCVVPRGVTTAICDPHEIANVAGAEGIRYFLDCALETVLDLRVQLSSCVPSTDMETSGAQLDFADLESFRNHPKVIGLAEFMNYPGVLAKRPDVMDKLAGFEGWHIDGHAPLLSGKDLNGYIAAGIRTEHEATSADEGLEKLRKGMHLLIREGSVSKDLHALLPLITIVHSPFLAFCTDDRNPLDIGEAGHIDYMIREAQAHGAPALAVYRAASISAARAFGLRDRGMVAPGWRADLAVIDSLDGCHAELVVSAGRVVDDDLFARRRIVEPVARNSVRAKPVEAHDLEHRSNVLETHIIDIQPGRIITGHLVEQISCENGVKHPDPQRDIAKISIIERHGRNGNVASGFVRGFGIGRGAIASTVCHDHHNIAVVGVDDADMAMAANRLMAIEGGFVVVEGGKVMAEVALPIAGLMSLKRFEEVHAELVELRGAARALGVTLEEPFLQLAFLALPVIPHLKITDRGMVDVDRFDFILSDEG